MKNEETIPVVVRSKTWVCSYSRAGVVGSNPIVVMDVCYQVEIYASDWSLVRPTECGAIVKPR